VDQGVHERAGHRIVDRPLEAQRRHARPLARAGFSQAGQDLVDGLPVVGGSTAGARLGNAAGERGEQVAGTADHVVDEVLHRPLLARRRETQLVTGHRRHDVVRPRRCAIEQIHRVVHRGLPRLLSEC
jgi:hypothetical protein